MNLYDLGIYKSVPEAVVAAGCDILLLSTYLRNYIPIEPAVVELKHHRWRAATRDFDTVLTTTGAGLAAEYPRQWDRTFKRYFREEHEDYKGVSVINYCEIYRPEMSARNYCLL